MSEVVISLKNIKKKFKLEQHKSSSVKETVISGFGFNKPNSDRAKTHQVLNGVSLEIKKGEFFGVLGKNGSGKSTLLKILSGIYQPTTGRVETKGKLVPFIELGVGFKQNLSGRDNVYLNGALLGFSRVEIDKKYNEIVKFAELEKFMDQKLKNYSSGMKVRLAFSVAIQAEADILVLDEILAVGDAAFQKKCNEYFKTLKDNKKTVILVTHSMKAVKEFCNRAVVIDEGKIIFEGEADQAADEYLNIFEDDEQKKEKEEKKEEEAEPERTGDKAITIHRIDVKSTNDEIRILAELKASNKSFSNIGLGFRIEDVNGRILIGANNMNISKPVSVNMKPNERKTIEFILPNILANNTYTISCTLTSGNGTFTHDHWRNIMSIENKRENVWYPLVAPAKVIVKTSLANDD